MSPFGDTPPPSPLGGDVICEQPLSILHVLSFFNFILQRPLKRCLIISHSQKIFQFCSKLFNESLRPFLSLVQAVLMWAVGRTRSGLRGSLKRLRKKLEYVL